MDFVLGGADVAVNGSVSGSRIVWTDEMDAALKTAMRDGEPVFRLAPRLGVSQSACWKRARTKGWERPRGTHHRAPPTKDGVKAWTAEQLDELKGGCMAGDPFARIAPRVGFSEGACKDKAREMGWLPAGRLPSGANARQARRAWISTLAAALCIAAAPAWAQEPPRLGLAPIDGPYRRVEVVDGDTVTLSVSAGLIRTITIRLKDIDAPETYRPGCDQERSKGEAATSRLAALTSGRVRIVSYIEIDSAGRLLARLYDRQGRDVGDVLVAEGLARPLKDGEARKPWCPAPETRR